VRLVSTSRRVRSPTAKLPGPRFAAFRDAALE
jgi:hypothetical protein